MAQRIFSFRSRAFLVLRALAERRAARRATCTEARFAHRKLAQYYVREARAARRASDPAANQDEGATP